MAVSLVRKGFAWNACPAEESDWHNLSATWTKLPPVLLSLSCWQRSIPTKCGWALAQLRSRSSVIISSNGNSQGTTHGAVTRPRRRTRRT